MTSKERIRNAIEHKAVDRVPSDWSATWYVNQQMMKRYRTDRMEEVLTKLEIDMRSLDIPWNGPDYKKTFLNDKDYEIDNMWSGRSRQLWSGIEYNGSQIEFPFNDESSIDEIMNHSLPDLDLFDLSGIEKQCDQHRDKGIIMGHEGTYQIITNLMRDDHVYMAMALYPEKMKALFKRIYEWEIEKYTRIFEAGDGQIDVLITHDDFGTQISTLFSMEMWTDYFFDQTRVLSDLAHKYGAFFMQHSCGAIRPVIPELIRAGVDALDPVQPTRGMDPESLSKEFGGKICFHGGIDTQHLLPFGTQAEVRAEVKRYISCLNNNGGYILYPSQAWESCVPVENIEALYSIRD